MTEMPALLKTLASISRGRVLVARVGGAARREKAQRSEFYLQAWRSAAEQIGARVVESSGEMLQISRDNAVAKVYRNYTDLDGPVTLRAAGDKPLVHKALRARGIPTPEFLTFSLDELAAAEAFLESHTECVVKPAAGTGAGAGVTTGVRTPRQLRKAAIAAAGHGSQHLIERHILGSNLRLLFLDGQLLDAVERRPPTVVGDGRSTVARLVRVANQRRGEEGSRTAQVFLRRDLDMERTLAEQGLSWRSVPSAGQRVRLKTVVNDNAAADNISVANRLPEEIVQLGRQAAHALGVRLAGVDIICQRGTDTYCPPAVVLEVNTTPGLYIHKQKEGVPVAVPILEACLEQSRVSTLGWNGSRLALVGEGG